MKKVLLLLIVTAFSLPLYAQQVSKQTFLYSVKDSDSLYLDHYTTVCNCINPEKKPCLIFVFGGGFVSGERDAKHYIPYFNYLAESGFSVVSIDYRLGLRKAIESGQLNPETFGPAFMQTLFMAIDDLYDATLFVMSQSDKWNIDKDKIVTMGSSAGAITVLMGEYYICNNNMIAQKLPSKFNYAGVISMAGAIFDIGDDLKWKSAPAPMMLFHGDADANVPYDAIREAGAGFFGSRYISKELTKIKSPYWFYSAANTDHSLAISPMNENRYEIDAFLQKLVFQKQKLIIDTHMTPIDKPEAKKDFKLMDYVKSNFR